jgi:hypothetical protein
MIKLTVFKTTNSVAQEPYDLLGCCTRSLFGLVVTTSSEDTAADIPRDQGAWS